MTSLARVRENAIAFVSVAAALASASMTGRVDDGTLIADGGVAAAAAPRDEMNSPCLMVAPEALQGRKNERTIAWPARALCESAHIPGYPAVTAQPRFLYRRCTR